MKQKLYGGGAVAGMVFAGVVGGTVSAETAAAVAGLTEEQVIELALMEVPGTVEEVELDDDDGMLVYEIEILGTSGREYEVEIAADTGILLDIQTEEKND